MIIIEDVGYDGTPSLGGVRGSEHGRGRLYTVDTFGLTPAAVNQVLNANSKRLSALIVNAGANPMVVYFDPTYTSPAALLNPGGSLQIDKNLPWTGAVFCGSNLGVAAFYVSEISVP